MRPARPAFAPTQRKLLFVALLASALDLYFYSGFYMSDDLSYLSGILHARYYAPCLFAALLVSAASLVGASDWASRRLGAARPRLGRCCQLAPTAVIASLALLIFARVEHRAGAVYRAHQAKSAMLAFGDARRLHPELPIMLSDYLSKRLAPLIAAAKSPPLLAPNDSTAAPPARPFLFLRASSHDEDSFRPVLDALKETNAIEIIPDGQKVYLARYGRRAEIAAAASALRIVARRSEEDD